MMAARIVAPRERNRFLRFAVVGILGAVVDFGVFNLLTSVVWVKPVYASMLSFAAAVCSNFIWNRYWTYPDSRSKRISQQIIQFAIISVIGLAIRTPIFVNLEAPLISFFDFLHLPLASLSPTFLGHNLALAIAVLVVMFWNFFINRYWTYGDVN